MYTLKAYQGERGGKLKKIRRQGTLIRQLALIVLIALILPLSANLVIRNADVLGDAGERVATFAAVANMPGSGLDILRERFRQEIYGYEEDAGHAIQPIPTLPVTQMPATAETPPTAAEEEEADQGTILRVQPKIPEEFRGTLLSENFAATGNVRIRYGAGAIKNDTKHDDEDVEAILETPMGLVFEDTDEPQVLIYHTHATEAFETYDSDVYDVRNNWRSSDNNKNMVAVGAAMTKTLEDNGIAVIHSTIQHDYPSYNGSYAKSAKTVSDYLEEYPSIRVVLDLHRDGIEREGGVIVKPVAEIDGKKAAQIMLISGCDDGTMNMPQWRENLRFAATFQDCMERDYPDLTRPVYFAYRKYNQDLSPGALLVEIGSNANTLDEAVYSATLAGQALANLIHDSME